jgi:hypothetical protein
MAKPFNERLMDFQRLGFLPFTFPIAAFGCDFANVDFRVEVCRERQTMVSRVGVDDVDVMNLIEQMLLGIGAVDVGHTRIEAAAQQRHETFFLKPLVVGPLILVAEPGFVARFVIGRIEVIHPCFHQCQILVRQRHVNQHIWLYPAQ